MGAKVMQDRRLHARQLYWRGFNIADIARHLDVARTTMQSWSKAEGWNKARPVERMVGALEFRMVNLIDRESKSGLDFKELDALTRSVVQLQGGVPAAHFGAALGADGSRLVPDHVGRLPAAGAEPGEPGAPRRRVRSAQKAPKNHFEPEHATKLREALLDSCFDYQRLWFDNRMRRQRWVLKTRQAGATRHFAREGLVDALELGNTQVYLSASRAQAYHFKRYQLNFLAEVLDMTMEGDPVRFSNGAYQYFLGTNIATAQGQSGNLFFDEAFWVPKFGVMEGTAGAIATHSKFRKTYFSTPSTVDHDAYAMWTGERSNEGRPKSEQVEVNLAEKLLRRGHLGADGIWRHRLNIVDALAGGLDKHVSLAQIKRENSPARFDNLYMCGFVDGSIAVFPYAWLSGCGVDSWDVWAGDWQPFAPRPFGYKGVWLGYDPTGRSADADCAGLAVLAPPDVPGGSFRVLEKHRLTGNDFAAQAAFIKKVCERYNVLRMGIDVTGIGQAVFELVQQFYPAATPIHFSVESKGALVMGAQNVMRHGRLQWDAGDTELTQSFMSIKNGTTPGGLPTYLSRRSKNTGHADLAWAVMNALSFEPLTGAAQGEGYVRVYG